jgi:hypothetical protein
MKKFLATALALLLLTSLFACGGGEGSSAVTTLPPVETVGLPEEDVTQSINTGEFTVNIFSSYAEIVEYVGEGKTEVTVPASILGVPVKTIGEYAFYGNETVTKVTLPSSLIMIDRFAFEECKVLTEVVAEEGLEVVGQSAFRGCIALSTFVIPSTVVTIGKNCFYRTALTEVVIPDGVSIISSYAFYGCEALTSVTFGKRVSLIDEKAFHNCKSLKLTSLPVNVTRLGDYAFMNCTSITDIFLPKTTAVGENAFYGCPELVIHTPKGAKAVTAAKSYGYKYVICATVEEMNGGK